MMMMTRHDDEDDVYDCGEKKNQFPLSLQKEKKSRLNLFEMNRVRNENCKKKQATIANQL